MKIAYKLIRSVIPCVLLTLCIGFCYSFSLFVPHIVELMGCSTVQVGFTFCLNIFFLGMGAATFGPLAEKNIKLSAFVSFALLTIGLGVAGFACSIHSLWLLYIGAGLLCGLAEGVGYITPNKNMMLWFPKSRFKGLLTAISIFTFGLGSSICAWMFGILFTVYGIAMTFYALACIYAVPMLASVILINKPRYALLKIAKEKSMRKFSYIDTIKDRFFQKCWLFMFLNISMGLILIGSCASILSSLGLSSSMVIFVMMMCGIFNGVGRLVFPAIGDFLVNRCNIWVITAIFEIMLMLPLIFNVSAIWISAICIILIHAGYGSAFACLPGILSSHYGKDTLSQRHGFCLTSWGMASVMAFLCSTFVLKMFNGFYPVMIVVIVGYVINLVVSRLIAVENRN